MTRYYRNAAQSKSHIYLHWNYVRWKLANASGRFCFATQFRYTKNKKFCTYLPSDKIKILSPLRSNFSSSKHKNGIEKTKKVYRQIHNKKLQIQFR